MSDDPIRLHVYCDESGWNTGRFMVVGGIIVPHAALDSVEFGFETWRSDHAMYAEAHWGKVSRAKLPAYKGLVDTFFWYAKTQGIAFRCAVFDRRQVDCRAFHQGDDLLAFDKLYYQFLLHKFGCCATSDEDRLYAFLDEKSRRTSLDDIRLILNRGIRKTYGRNADVVKTVGHVRSHDCTLVQVADVLMGAVRYQCCGDHLLSAASPAKVELAEYVAKKAGLRALRASTPKGWPNLEVWRFRFREAARATP